MKKIIIFLLAMLFFSFGTGITFINMGVPIRYLWDFVAFTIVVIPAYFFTVMSSNTFNILNNKESLKQFGNSAITFSYCGVSISLVSLVFVLSTPIPPGVDPKARWAGLVSLAVVSMLYGILVKYVFCKALINVKKD